MIKITIPNIPNNIKDVITSPRFLNWFFLIVFLLCMTGVVASQNFLFQQVVENGISKKDVIAQKTITVEDTKRTEQHRKEVAQRVEPILTVTEDDYIRNNLASLQSSILKIREKDTSIETKRDELGLLFDSDDMTKKQFIITYLLKSSESDLKNVFDKSKLTLINVLNAGISEKDFDNHKLHTVINQHMATGVSRSQSTVINGLLEQVLVPNLVVDEFATDIARKNAQNSVKPYEVVFEKGDKILFEGEPVTKLKRDALRQAGYNLVELNFFGLLGILFVMGFSTFAFLMYQKTFGKTPLNTNQLEVLGVMSVIIATIAIVLPTGFSPYVLPFPAFIMLVAIFTNPRLALIASIILLSVLTLGLQYNIQFVTSFTILNIVTATMMAKLSYSNRFDLIKSGLNVALVGALIVAAVYMLEKFLIDVENVVVLRDSLFVFLNGILSSMFVLGILPLIEKVFGFITPYGLAELADHNQPVLKRLQMEAPGTFHHSLMVSNLCEAAAEAIGADQILAKVGAYYHDIGKLQRPFFFVENQSSFGIENPHNKLNPRLSKMVVTAHTKDGVEIAKKYGLPKVLNEFILQHHGEGLASYFYNQAIKEEGAENVKEEQFRYSGPKPQTKETAILMIADAVEAAARAMKASTQEEVDAIIKNIIDERLKDDQLSDCPLTLKDLKVISQAFSRTLRGTSHERIKYQQNELVEQFKNSKNILPSQMHIMDKEIEEKVKELEQGKDDKTDN